MEIKDSTTNNASFGAVLKQARKDKKLKIADVAKELFIKERQIEALENEEFDKLPQYTFSKGFALKCAELLELDATEIAIKFDEAYPQSHRVNKTSDIQAPLKPMGTLTRDNRKKIHFNPWLVFAIFGVLALAITFIRVVNHAEKEQNTVNEQPLQESITIIEQQKGASIDSNNGNGTDNESNMPSSGSAINLN